MADAPQPQGDFAELRTTAGGDDDSCAAAGLHHRPHEETAGHLA
ncbi:hypothetical protein NHF46_08435 [Arthrobacter alpinus]|nr:hypothetical protein [Arthrobacter alpinus]